MVRGDVVFYVLKARVLGCAPGEALGPVRDPRGIYYSKSYTTDPGQSFPGTGVEIERQMRRARADSGEPE